VKRGIVVLPMLVCAMVLMDGTIAVADTQAPPAPYSIKLEGDKTFYMTPPGLQTETQPSSGLYHNTIPPTSIYSTSVFYYENELVLSRDGSCFAGLPWVTISGDGKLDGVAVSFYNMGVAVKSYTVADLLADAGKATFSVSHVMWEDRAKRSYDAATNALTVTTLDGSVYVFDLATGAIIDVKRTSPPPSGQAPSSAPSAGHSASSVIVPVLLGLGVILAVALTIASVAMRKSRR